MKQYAKILLSIITIIGIAGCAGKPRLPEESQTPAGPSVLTKSYKMAVGDQVQINVWKNPELSVSGPIRPDGKVSVPLIGEVMAVGNTPEQLAANIERKLTGACVHQEPTFGTRSGQRASNRAAGRVRFRGWRGS